METISQINKRFTISSGRFSNGEDPNFHGNTCLGQTHCYFNLTGTSHIVHSLDVDVNTDNWNLFRHSVDVLYPIGLSEGICGAEDLLTYETDWSGEQVHVCYVITQEVEVGTANWNLCGYLFNLYPC